MKSKNKTKKFVAVLLSGVLALSLFALFGATPVKAATVEELTAQINSLLAMIATLQSQLAGLQGGSAATASTGYTFTRNLKQGDTGEDVKQLQKALNAAGVTVSVSGAGSPGNETINFGPATKAAVMRFQEKYASEILAPVGLSAGTGFVGASTRAKLNSLGGAIAAAPAAPAAPTTPTTPTTPAVVVPAGSGLTVTAAAQQPAAQLAPLSAARIPFTKVTFTASADGDVTVNGLVVERTGQSVDAAIDGVILLNENGLQLGIAKTLNSSHQATLTEPFTVKAGQSRTMTIAANRPTSGTSAHAGMVAGLSLVQVNTSATVNGSFPISGTAQTINEGLTIGSVTMNRGALDPSTTATKEVGVTGYTFSSIRVTAGSAENIRLRSIKWNESGSVSASDLANVKTYVDGTAYDTVQSGDYYTASFGTGIVIEKGFSKEISIKGDIIGGSARTTAFDIAKRTDLDVGGELYGYGIVPPQTNSCSGTTGTACFTSAEDPWWDGAVVTVSAGTMNVSTSNAAPAQNIAVNTANQPLGAFTVDVKGEPITVARIGFNVSLTGQGSGDDVDDITNVTLVDENGSVVAGPVDGSATDDHAQVAGASMGAFVFTDTVTFPIGVKTYKLLGKVDTSMDNNTTIAASTTPSSDFATVKGTVTNTTITPAPTSALTFSTMTVKAGALTISRISEPPAQTIIAGGKGIEFARYSLNASASGEDVRVTTLPLYYDRAGGGGRNDLTNCQIFDAISGTALTTGSNVKNPVSTDTASSTSFTFDGNGLIVPKGTSKTLSVKCDLKTGTSGATFWWGIDNEQGGSSNSYTGVSGIASGATIAETINEAAGQVMTAAAGGSYTVAPDRSSLYDYRAVRAGTADVPLAAFKFEADLTEELSLRQIALQLGNVASNSPLDLVNQRLTIWNGATKVGETDVNNDSSPNYATSTLSTPVKLGKGPSGAVTLVVKGSLRVHDSNTNTTSTATDGGYGAFLAITYDGDNNDGVNGNYAVGIDSGTNRTGGTTSDQTTNGVRIFANVPTIRIADLGVSNALETSNPLYKFTVTNPDASRDLLLYKMSFAISTSGDTSLRVTDFILAGGGVDANTAVNATDVETGGSDLDAVEILFGANEARRVPKGESKEYTLRATVVGGLSTTVESINIRLLKDTAYPSLQFLMGKVSSINVSTASSTNNIIWSPVSTTSVTTAATAEENLDWTNGYGIPIYDIGATSVSAPGAILRIQTSKN